MHAEVAQSVEQGTENPRVGSSILPLGTICELVCGSGSVVEHRLAKARVAGSNPVFRSIFYLHRVKAHSLVAVDTGDIAKW